MNIGKWIEKKCSVWQGIIKFEKKFCWYDKIASGILCVTEKKQDFVEMCSETKYPKFT